MFRLLAGPSTLDRLVALDTLVAVTMCGIGTWAAFSLDTTVTYSLAALALISFVGSVSIARFRVPDNDGPGGAGDERSRHRVRRAGPRRLGAGADRGHRRGPLPRHPVADARRDQAAGARAAAGARRRRDPAARPCRRRHDHPDRHVHPDHRAGGGATGRPVGLPRTERRRPPRGRRDARVHRGPNREASLDDPPN